MKYRAPAKKLKILAGIGALTCCLGVLPLCAGSRGQAEGESGEQFFLISSVDAKKHQIVLKAPTEVTELARVTDKTVYRDEQGKPMQFKDLRAGDTVYVVLSPAGSFRPSGSTASSAAGEGLRVVTRIRKGEMTPEELHRRYLRFK